MKKIWVLLLAGTLVLNFSGTSLAAKHPARHPTKAKHSTKHARKHKSSKSSAQTMRIQRDLKLAGYDPGPIDGKMGPKTRTAIKAFQKDNHLKVDGIVGPKTWAKLSTYSKSGHYTKKTHHSRRFHAKKSV
jgi:peptidoglycan hydrolase-like protein with peptidoglycan-binding domain